MNTMCANLYLIVKASTGPSTVSPSSAQEPTVTLTSGCCAWIALLCSPHCPCCPESFVFSSWWDWEWPWPPSQSPGLHPPYHRPCRSPHWPSASAAVQPFVTVRTHLRRSYYFIYLLYNNKGLRQVYLMLILQLQYVHNNMNWTGTFWLLFYFY